MRVLRAGGLLVVVGSALFLTAAQAEAVTLSTLFGNDPPKIIANDKLFGDFNLLNLQTFNGGLVNLDLIDVTPLEDNPFNPGLKFSAPIGALGTPFGHAGLSSALLEFEFNVKTSSKLPLIKDNSLLINGYAFDAGPGAFIQITEQVLDPAGNPLGDKLAIVRNGDLPGNPNHFDSAEFAPHSLVHVVKRIYIEGPGDNDGAFLTMFEQRFSQVPEPSSLTIAAGLFLILLIRRRCCY